MHQLMAATLDTVIEEIHAIQHEARAKEIFGLSGVADDYSAHSERLDWTESCGRQTS